MTQALVFSYTTMYTHSDLHIFYKIRDVCNKNKKKTIFWAKEERPSGSADIRIIQQKETQDC